jgi:hypothetical protein
MIIFSAGFVRGQLPGETGPTLEKLFGRLKSSSEDSVRIRINDSIRVIIENYTKSDSVFYNAFGAVKNLGQLISADSQIKIITWNLVLANNKGWYFCYLVKKGLKGNKNAVYKLEKRYDPGPISADTTYDQSDWYGALYYDIKRFKVNGKPCYILLGINYSDPLITRKIIDILSFTPANTLLFGLKRFNTGKGTHFRHVFEYASNGVMSLRFSAANSIVFDHLAPIPSVSNEGRILYGSDYSFDAYILKDGFWNLNLNIDVRNKKPKGY